MQSAARLVIFLLFLSPMVAGQSDAAGDHELAAATAMGNGWIPLGTAGPYKDMDLIDLEVLRDSPDEITWLLRTASMARGMDPFRSDMDIKAWIRFTIDENRYQIHFWEEGGQTPWLAELQRLYDDQPFTLGRVPIEQTDAGFMIPTPRQWLRDADGNTPGKGDAIRGLSVSLLGEQLGGFDCPDDDAVAACAIKVRDRHPDTGTLDAYTIASEAGQTYGHIQLTNPSPLRASNGEATTYIFDAQLKNLGAEADTLHFTIAGQPPGWTVHGPGRLTLAAGETQRYAVAVSVPFSHQHGITTTLNVTIQSELDPAVQASTRFGVQWIDPPQPAGHHDTLYLHYGPGGSNGLSMDTLPRGEAQSPNLFSYASPNGTGIDVESNRLDIPLLPALLLGIDADPTRTGTATIVLDSQIAGTHVLNLDFWYHPNPQEPNPAPRRLFTVDDVPIAIAAGRNTFEAPIDVLPAADYVPLDRPGGLTLDLRITKTHPDGDFTPGAGQQADLQIVTEETRFQIPLFEYHDPVPVDTAGELRLQAASPLELRRAPGATAMFHLEILGATGDLIVDASPGFATTLYREGGRRYVEASHLVGSDLPAGSNIDAVITIIDEASGSQAFAVVRIIVDPAATASDASRPLEASAQTTPGPLPVAIIALVAAIAHKGARQR